MQAAVSDALSIEPVVGVTLSTFLSQKGPSSAAYADVTNRSVSVQFLAGVIGRFDLFGHALLASN